MAVVASDQNATKSVDPSWKCAPNCEIAKIGNGVCENACDTPGCDYDGRDCDPCLRESPYILESFSYAMLENVDGTVGDPLTLENSEEFPYGPCFGYPKGHEDDENSRVEFTFVDGPLASFDIVSTAPNSGQISVKAGFFLDFEANPMHELAVRVTGCSLPSPAPCMGTHYTNVTVRVTVLDVPDAALTASPTLARGGDVTQLETKGGDVVLFEGTDLGVVQVGRATAEVEAWCAHSGHANPRAPATYAPAGTPTTMKSFTLWAAR